MNKIVKVIIDRPLGSYHPKHEDIYYFINFQEQYFDSSIEMLI